MTNEIEIRQEDRDLINTLGMLPTYRWGEHVVRHRIAAYKEGLAAGAAYVSESVADRASVLEEAARIAETLPEEPYTDCNLHAHAIASAIRALASTPPIQVAAQSAGTGWRPIESAPKDGTPFLSYVHPHVEMSHWALSFGGRFVVTNHGYAITPTHWMPLPAAPTGEEAGR